MISVMVMCCVFFAVRTESLNIIYTSFRFKGLNHITEIPIVSQQTHTDSVSKLVHCYQISMFQ
jgi:hypothetical protein